MRYEAHPKAALHEEDESAWEGGALTQDREDVLAGHIACIHHQLQNEQQQCSAVQQYQQCKVRESAMQWKTAVQ